MKFVVPWRCGQSRGRSVTPLAGFAACEVDQRFSKRRAVSGRWWLTSLVCHQPPVKPGAARGATQVQASPGLEPGPAWAAAAG
jgi:hypothetical protein